MATESWKVPNRGEITGYPGGAGTIPFLLPAIGLRTLDGVLYRG
jgi:hypothetical protein